MKIKKLSFPSFELLLFVMITFCGVIVSSLLLYCYRITTAAKHLTIAVNEVRSVGEVFLADKLSEIYEIDSDVSFFTINFNEDYITVEIKTGQLIEATISYYDKFGLVYSSNILRYPEIYYEKE